MRSFLRRWRKYSKLHALSRKHSQPPLTVEAIVDGSSDCDLKELFIIVLQDNDCVAVLTRFGGSAQTLHEMFWELLRAGAGQWSENLYIPYIALAEPWTLEYLLRRRSQSAPIVETAFRIVTFYQDKKPLNWLRDDSGDN